MAKYYRTVITYEVLSQDPYSFSDLAQTAYDVMEGDCSGMELNTTSEELTAQEMAERMDAQGSDWSFFYGLEEAVKEEEDLEAEEK